MNKFLKSLIGLVAGIGLVLGLTGCATEPLDLGSVTSVIDVRTPDEFAAGHLQNAVNVDVESADFAERIAQFDKAGKYLIYCHSGRRAGIAVDDMKALGFTDITNIGGIDEAASKTGLPIVQ